MKKAKKCLRCESIGRKPKEGVHEMIGPNGVRTLICEECYQEIQNEDIVYEIKEDEGTS